MVVIGRILGSSPAGAVAEATGQVAGEILGGLDGLFTSDDERAAAEYRLRELMQRPQIIQGLTTLAEAHHPNWFVAGWRPALGWMCVLGLAWEYLGRPMWATLLEIGAVFFADAAPRLIQAAANLPHLDAAQLMALVGVLLGVGTLRTVEKVQGVARG